MERTLDEWLVLIKQYEISGQTIAGFCKANNLEINQFKNARYRHLYTVNKSKPKKPVFKEFNLGHEYKISIDTSGNASLSGIPRSYLPDIMKVVFALSK